MDEWILTSCEHELWLHYFILTDPIILSAFWGIEKLVCFAVIIKLRIIQ